jgi:hypothetical protein
MKRLIALRETYYNGTRQTGETFEATDTDANLLVCIGHAKLAPVSDDPPAPPPPPNTPMPHVVGGTGTASGGANPIPAPKPKRKYQRRDMRAEG